MKGNANLSTIQATYFPPSIQPVFMGAHPPIKSGYGSFAESGNISYFQDYRNENLAKFQMPPYEWGLMSTLYSPRPDLVAANKAVLDKISTEPRFTNINFLDPIRQQELDNFYQACQMHRNQYKDHSGRLHSLDYFQMAKYPYSDPPDLTSTYLKYPTKFIQYRKPLVLPRTLERTSRFPSLPDRSLYGRYSRHPDNSYNR